MKDNKSVIQLTRENEMAYDDAIRRELEVQQHKDELKKAAERERQRLYKETLDKQRELKKINEVNFGSMTQVEKHINKGDLGHFKKADAEVGSLIPGISHVKSVGSMATCRRAHVQPVVSINPEEFVRENSRDVGNVRRGRTKTP